MKVPRDIEERTDRILKAIREKLGTRPTEEEVRHAIKEEMAEEKFTEIFRIWQAEFEEVLSMRDVGLIMEAYDELVNRIQREPIMKESAYGPTLDAKWKKNNPDYEVTTMAEMYTIIATITKDEELRQINLATRDSEGWEPTSARAVKGLTVPNLVDL